MVILCTWSGSCYLQLLLIAVSAPTFYYSAAPLPIPFLVFIDHPQVTLNLQDEDKKVGKSCGMFNPQDGHCMMNEFNPCMLMHLHLHKDQAPVVQWLYNAIHRINHSPVGSIVCFANTYPFDGDLSSG